jgi:hypothetical protein
MRQSPPVGLRGRCAGVGGRRGRGQAVTSRAAKGDLKDAVCVDAHDHPLRDRRRRSTRYHPAFLERPAGHRLGSGRHGRPARLRTCHALRRGGGVFTLRLTAHPSLTEVAVDDPGPRTPRMRAST